MILVMLGSIVFYAAKTDPHVRPMAPIIHAAAADQPMYQTKQFAASLDVARVFGRSQGCADADPKLINDIAAEAIASNTDPRILAALVAVESSCDPMAVSNRGAIGLTQVRAKVWKDKFDFAGKTNLLNPADNLHAGATILGSLIKQYGTLEGVRRYQGDGVGCATCDDFYVPKILALAGRR
jgi:soluble lytic murein transglycosylase-like protein